VVNGVEKGLDAGDHVAEDRDRHVANVMLDGGSPLRMPASRIGGMRDSTWKSRII